MKQEISLEQYSELSPKASKILEKWCIDRGYNPMTMTLGQMIEYLDRGQLSEDEETNPDNWTKVATFFRIDKDYLLMDWTGELCDSLWLAVREKTEISAAHLS